MFIVSRFQKKMTNTEAIFKRMKSPPKSTILVGGRSESELIDTYFAQSAKSDILWVSDFVSDSVSSVQSHSVLSPKGQYRVVCVKSICGARKDNQSTLLKLIEESPEQTRWVLSVDNLDRVLKPLLSRSFVMDWVTIKPQTLQFQDDLLDLVKSPSYFGICKLHNLIVDESKGVMEDTKKLHLVCLTELMQLLPACKSVKVLKTKNEMKSQLRTEIAFKSILTEVLL